MVLLRDVYKTMMLMVVMMMMMVVIMMIMIVLMIMMISIVDIDDESSYVNDDLWIFSQCGCWDVVETNRSGSPDRAVTVMRRSSSSEGKNLKTALLPAST